MTEFIYDRVFQVVFDEAYRASLAPEVAKLLDEPDAARRMADAQQLAAEGHSIDVPIQVWGWNPYMTMAYRLIDGLTWVPSALQPSIGLLTPASQNPPYDPYDPTKPPAGSIKVSLQLSDYPPFTPVVIPQPPSSAKFVGEVAFGKTYKAGPGTIIKGNYCNVTDGEAFEQDGSHFVAKVSINPFGVVVFYIKQ